MNEELLIKKFREITEQIEDTKSIMKDSNQINSIRPNLDDLQKLREDYIFQLRSCQDKTLTSKKIESVRTILIQLNNKFSKKYSYNFSRDQGTIIYGEIIKDCR